MTLPYNKPYSCYEESELTLTVYRFTVTVKMKIDFPVENIKKGKQWK